MRRRRRKEKEELVLFTHRSKSVVVEAHPLCGALI